MRFTIPITSSLANITQLDGAQKAHTQAASKKEIYGYARVADYLATLMEQIRQTSTSTSPPALFVS